jgi:hypothetical protein
MVEAAVKKLDLPARGDNHPDQEIVPVAISINFAS